MPQDSTGFTERYGTDQICLFSLAKTKVAALFYLLTAMWWVSLLGDWDVARCSEGCTRECRLLPNGLKMESAVYRPTHLPVVSCHQIGLQSRRMPAPGVKDTNPVGAS